MNNEERDSIDQWLLKAREDWETVTILLDSPKSPNAVICFHCQQYIEKLLKAPLTSGGIEFPKTHNLRYLMSLLTATESRFNLHLDDADELSLHGVGSRYPDDRSVVTKTQVKRVVRLTKRLAEIALGSLNSNR